MGRPIDEEKVISIVEYECGEWVGLAKEITKQIKALPSAKPRIIRCKDCKYSHMTYDGLCKYCDNYTDDYGVPITVYFDGNFYCGFGKRREDGQRQESSR